MVGARPNLPKAWALLGALARMPGLRCRLVHTGQHYDAPMSEVFFEELGLPRPVAALAAGSGSHAEQTARVMARFDRVLAADPPDAVVVIGDVNSTLACALVAAKRGIRIAHVEAGLRSGDWTMPEEINRVLTDRLADDLFAPSADAVRNLRREGIPASRIHLVGSVLADTLRAQRGRAERSGILGTLGVRPRGYAVLTLHRPANVDAAPALRRVLSAVRWLQDRVPVVFPVHPRTRRRLARGRLGASLRALPNVTITPPLGYLPFVKLMAHARLVLTDSGGVQEETTILGIPCVTLRDTTERPVTVRRGTNVLAGVERAGIVAAVRRALATRGRPAGRPPLWDGRAARRIARILARRLNRRDRGPRIPR